MLLLSYIVSGIFIILVMLLLIVNNSRYSVEIYTSRKLLEHSSFFRILHPATSSSIFNINANADTATPILSNYHPRANIPSNWSHIPMPKISYFGGFHAPNNQTKWEEAIWQAHYGEQILLNKIVEIIKSPFDLLKSNRYFKWVHHLAEIQLVKNFNQLNQFPKLKTVIAHFGYRIFPYTNFEGKSKKLVDFGVHNVLQYLKKEQKSNPNNNPISRKIIGIGLMDENWGYFSTYFVNRTTDWGHLFTRRIEEKVYETDEQKLTLLLDNPNVLMVLVNQHQNLSHPKVLSLPLGINDHKLIWKAFGEVKRKNLKRNQLIITAGSNNLHRPAIKKCVQANMRGELYQQPSVNKEQFYEILGQTISVLCMPGLGYDTYRLWEVLALGSMPILERGIGYDRTLYRLPALLVDDFADLTPELVRQAYVEALYRADEWEYERITHMWYERLLYEVAETGTSEPLLRLHPMIATDVNFCRPLVPFNCELMGGCGPGTKRTPKKSCAIDFP